jgi:alginate O-acetyltransferase complex protein AlgI
MVFASLTFLYFFLPACLLTYYAFPQRLVRNFVLIVFSLIFYAWGEPVWVCLLMISAVWDYFAGLWIEKHIESKWLAKIGILSSLSVNLGLLIAFKYVDFIVQNINLLTNLHLTQPGIRLPIGISFYTFQTISYTVGVYTREVKAQRNFINFALFVVSFHQLVAGPIVRYSHVVKEIEGRIFKIEDLSAGITLFCRGLFKKVVFANIAGELCAQLLGHNSDQTTVLAQWFGVLMYSFQIYFDFSGYSDMALGLGRMFGFHYNANFNYPYIAKSMTEFWRRWHISLGQFFKNYVYIPLGGSRTHANRNVLIVWMLTGIWHGASWNFVIWGLYFALILVIEKNILLKLFERLPQLILHLYSVFLILIGWTIFYFSDLSKLVQALQIMFGLTRSPLYNYENIVLLSANLTFVVLAAILATPLPSQFNEYLKRRFGEVGGPGWEVLQNILFLGLSTLLLIGKTYNPFIYFRF